METVQVTNDNATAVLDCSKPKVNLETAYRKVLHLKRKTAWSNHSLIGCRISCLVDYKEWHEGIVTQFHHKSGKHFVEFRQVNEKRWLQMKKIAFYIVERPTLSSDDNNDEYKEDASSDCDGLAPIEENWVYVEDISLEYAFAQSVLFKIYGNVVQETGHLTKGHASITESDKIAAQRVKGSLLYGELLHRGANKAFDIKRLDAGRATVLFDLGMGTGKLLIHAFLQFKNLRYVFGVELSAGRYKLAEEAVLRMIHLLGEEHYHVEVNPGKYIVVTERVGSYTDRSAATSGSSNHSEHQHFAENASAAAADAGGVGQNASRAGTEINNTPGTATAEVMNGDRILHFECGNMFDVNNMELADVVLMETDIPADNYGDLCRLLGSAQDGVRILSYLDLRRIWDVGVHGPQPFKQLDINRNLSDRYPTSWSVQRGHHFYLWGKVPPVEGFSLRQHLTRSNNGDASPASNSPGHQFNASSLVSFTLYHVSSQMQSTHDMMGHLSFDDPELAHLQGVLHSDGDDDSDAGDDVSGDDEEEEMSRCLPCSMRMFNLFDWGRRLRRRGLLGDGSANQEKVSDRSVIPVNDDGSRATSPTTAPARTATTAGTGSNHPPSSLTIDSFERGVSPRSEDAGSSPRELAPSMDASPRAHDTSPRRIAAGAAAADSEGEEREGDGYTITATGIPFKRNPPSSSSMNNNEKAQQKSPRSTRVKAIQSSSANQLPPGTAETAVTTPANRSPSPTKQQTASAEGSPRNVTFSDTAPAGGSSGPAGFLFEPNNAHQNAYEHYNRKDSFDRSAAAGNKGAIRSPPEPATATAAALATTAVAPAASSSSSQHHPQRSSGKKHHRKHKSKHSPKRSDDGSDGSSPVMLSFQHNTSNSHSKLSPRGSSMDEDEDVRSSVSLSPRNMSHSSRKQQLAQAQSQSQQLQQQNGRKLSQLPPDDETMDDTADNNNAEVSASPRVYRSPHGSGKHSRRGSASSLAAVTTNNKTMTEQLSNVVFSTTEKPATLMKALSNTSIGSHRSHRKGSNAMEHAAVAAAIQGSDRPLSNHGRAGSAGGSGDSSANKKSNPAESRRKTIGRSNNQPRNSANELDDSSDVEDPVQSGSKPSSAQQQQRVRRKSKEHEGHKSGCVLS